MLFEVCSKLGVTLCTYEPNAVSIGSLEEEDAWIRMAADFTRMFQILNVLLFRPDDGQRPKLSSLILLFLSLI